MARQLNTYVHLNDATGAPHAFGPGDEVPAWASALIRNESVWDGDDESPEQTPEPARRGPGRPRNDSK